MKIKPNETIIDSDWTIESNKIAHEESIQIRERIYQLTHFYLENITKPDWDTLYRDPADHRLWELTYPKGEMHGGGYPRLSYISNEEAASKYGITL